MSPVFKVTNLFFDRAAVMKAVGRARVPSLTMGAGFVRKWARRLMRYRKKGSSPPGVAPFSHPQYGAKLRKLLFYSYDPSSQSAVVGPVPLSSKSTIGATVPNVHEFGGRVVHKRKVFANTSGRKSTPAQKASFRRLVKEGHITSTPRKTVTYAATYPPRPYMGPSLRAGIDSGKILSAWSGAVRGAA